ncbi:MAG: diadenylate cyclase CdaA [Chloroflexota bacterium]|nr:diadenylate cyclase CdaA [Chloroflexota bacterium]
MGGLINRIEDALGQFQPASVVDILIIAAIVYVALLLMRGTTAVYLMRGIVILLAVAFILVRLFELTVLDWLVRNSFPALLIAIPIIFQPEIRRFLERLGRTGRLGRALLPSYDSVLDAVIEASDNLSQRRHGALMVLERDTGLEDYADTGVRLDATPSVELLEGLFYPNSPLHDGAVVLRYNRVVAAACTLPLSERLDRGHIGTRHRAALGISERTDAVAIVVSEETGDISVAANGRMISRLEKARLRAILRSLFSAALEQDRVGARGLGRLFR